MRSAKVTGSRVHLHTFRIIRAHRIDPGAMTFNYPPFLAPDEAVDSAPWPGRHILAALGFAQGTEPGWQQPCLLTHAGQSVSIGQRQKGGSLPSLKFSLPLSMLFLPSLFCSGG